MNIMITPLPQKCNLDPIRWKKTLEKPHIHRRVAITSCAQKWNIDLTRWKKTLRKPEPHIDRRRAVDSCALPDDDLIFLGKENLEKPHIDRTRSVARSAPPSDVCDLIPTDLEKEKLEKSQWDISSSSSMLPDRSKLLDEMKVVVEVEKKSPSSHIEEEHSKIYEGDIVNIHGLLFTDYRDYLIRNNGYHVKAEQLEGKVVVLYFLLMTTKLENDIYERTQLIETFNEISHQKLGGFEVVFVVGSDTMEEQPLSSEENPDPEECFSEIFSHMPWTAIPYWDKQSRKRLERIFGLSNCSYHSPVYVVIEPNGKVLDCGEAALFYNFGPEGFPFTYQRLKFLRSQDRAAAKPPTSLKTLLASPTRDFVISNKRNKVLIDELEGKVVALFLYEHGYTDHELTEKLKMAYKELKERGEEFEVVLVNLHFTEYTCLESNEDSFWEIFEMMAPWLALPFKDWNCRKLFRIFNYRDNFLEGRPQPSLVIIGPHGRFVERQGAPILAAYGLAAYPFTREKAFELEAERLKNLKLDSIWTPNVEFKRKDGPHHVRFSELAGKRLLIFIEEEYCERNTEFVSMLKEKYIQRKGKDEEVFEVIHFCYTKAPNNDDVMTDLPWLVHPFREYPSYVHRILCNVFKLNGSGEAAVIAFERDGRLIAIAETSKLYNPVVMENFPFVSTDLEGRAMVEIKHYLYDIYEEYEIDDDDGW